MPKRKNPSGILCSDSIQLDVLCMICGVAIRKGHALHRCSIIGAAVCKSFQYPFCPNARVWILLIMKQRPEYGDVFDCVESNRFAESPCSIRMNLARLLRCVQVFPPLSDDLSTSLQLFTPAPNHNYSCAHMYSAVTSLLKKGDVLRVVSSKQEQP